MKSRNLLLLGLAIVCGLAAAVATKAFFYPSAPAPLRVVVAKKALPRGTAVKDYETLFEVKEMPANTQLPPNCLTALDQLKDKARDHVLKSTMTAGEPLSATNLMERNLAGLPASLHSGYIGFAVRVTAESAAGGNLEADDRVKVFSVQKLPGGERKARVLMKNIRVAAVDRVVDPTPEKKGAVPSTVTLEVTDDEAMRLRLAQEDGPLALGVIPYADQANLADRKGDPEPPPSLMVLVARQDIAKGTPLKDVENLFQLKAFPKDRLSGKGFLTSLDQLPRQGKALVFQKTLPAEQPFSVDYLTTVDPPAAPTLTVINPTNGEIWYWDETLQRYNRAEKFQVPGAATIEKVSTRKDI